MLRTANTLLTIGGVALSGTPALHTLKSRRESGDKNGHQALLRKKTSLLMNATCRAAGVTMDVKGLENIPAGPVLYVANHQGLLDALVMLTQMKDAPAFLIKQEAENIPLLRSWMDELQCIFVNRGDQKDAVKAIRAGINVINGGTSLVIFPEGTRSQGPDMGEFKGGAFKVAQRTGCPIVPVALDGTYRMFEAQKRVKPTTVHVRILKPILGADKLDRAAYKALPDQIKDAIQSELNIIRYANP